MTPRRILTAVVGWVGVAALAVAVAVAVAPATTVELLPAVGSLTELLAEFDGQLLLVAAAAFAGSLAVVFSRVGVSATEATDAAMDGRDGQPAEAVTVPTETITGSGLDRAFDRVRGASLDSTVDRLRGMAVAVERTTAGVDPETARDRVRHGEWTDDELAAAVLGEAVPVPVVARLRAWLDEEREARRRLRRTVAAVEARLDDDGPSGGGSA